MTHMTHWTEAALKRGVWHWARQLSSAVPCQLPTLLVAGPDGGRKQNWAGTPEHPLQSTPHDIHIYLLEYVLEAYLSGIYWTLFLEKLKNKVNGINYCTDCCRTKQILIISFLYSPDPSSSASTSEGLNSLPGGVTQALISEGSELLVTLAFSGNDFCTYLFTIKIRWRSTKKHSNKSPGCQTYSSLPPLCNISSTSSC